MLCWGTHAIDTVIDSDIQPLFVYGRLSAVEPNLQCADLAVENSDSGVSCIKAFFAPHKAFKKLFNAFYFLIRGQPTQIEAQKKCVRHVEIGKLGVEYLVRKQPMASCCVPAQNDLNILEIFGPAIWVVHVGDDFQQRCNARRRDTNTHVRRKVHLDSTGKYVIQNPDRLILN